MYSHPQSARAPQAPQRPVLQQVRVLPAQVHQGQVPTVLAHQAAQVYPTRVLQAQVPTVQAPAVLAHPQAVQALLHRQPAGGARPCMFLFLGASTRSIAKTVYIYIYTYNYIVLFTWLDFATVLVRQKMYRPS